ncbi:MAG: hypothetical protein ACFFB3_24250 [Candidatus Hodarchaeota archaeon]
MIRHEWPPPRASRRPRGENENTYFRVRRHLRAERETNPGSIHNTLVPGTVYSTEASTDHQCQSPETVIFCSPPDDSATATD